MVSTYYNVRLVRYGNKSMDCELFKKLIPVPGSFRKNCNNYGEILASPSTRLKNTFGFDTGWIPLDEDYNEGKEIALSCPLDEDELARRKENSIRCSCSRTRSKIRGYALSNDWEWFITFTFSSEQVDRYDYGAVSKKMSNYLNYMKKKCPDLRYLVIPELHKDGAYHFHGLFSHCEKLGLSYSGCIQAGKMVYNITSFRLGFTNVQEIGDSQKAASYILKYITKDLCAVSSGKRRYWHSRNLLEPVARYLCLEFKQKKDMFHLCSSLCDYRGASDYIPEKPDASKEHSFPEKTVGGKIHEIMISLSSEYQEKTYWHFNSAVVPRPLENFLLHCLTENGREGCA